MLKTQYFSSTKTFRNQTNLAYLCGKMEKVWDELKKIEAQGQQILSEAKDKAKKMTTLANQEAEKLIANGKVYAEEEGQQLYASTIQEANRNSNEQLKANQEVRANLRVEAEKRMEQAVSTVVDTVLEETKS
jgi:vacuolar-type H+-ATPase subunit H